MTRVKANAQGCNGKLGATTGMTVSAILKAIQKHAGRVKNGKHHFSVNDQMNAIIELADIGLKSIDIDTSVAVISDCAKVRRERQRNYE